MKAKPKTPEPATKPVKRTPRRPSADPFDQYLKETAEIGVLGESEQGRVLDELVEERDRWFASFLCREPALAALLADLERCERGEMSPARLIPGPPRPEPGRDGPAEHAERLLRIMRTFARLRGRRRPFASTRRNMRLVRAVGFVGLRPRVLERYREAAVRRGGPKVAREVEAARRAFLTKRQVVVTHNLRLVLKVARNYSHGSLPMSDLVQEGNVGLLRATESYSRRFGVRFSTYAYLWIRQSIIRAIEDKGRTIRIPVSVSQRLRRALREAIASGSGRDGPVRDLLANPSVSAPILSLNVTESEEEDLVGRIADDDASGPTDGLEAGSRRSAVRRALKQLSDRQQLVLRLRFGFDASRPHTLQEVGTCLGVSAERVRQIQTEALQALREGPEGNVLEDLVID